MTTDEEKINQQKNFRIEQILLFSYLIIKKGALTAAIALNTTGYLIERSLQKHLRKPFRTN